MTDQTCSSCGAALGEGARFCGHCGTAVQGAQTAQAAPSWTPPTPHSTAIPPMPAPAYPGYPPYPAYPITAPRTNGMAVASMVLGILWLYWIGSVLALIFGYIAKRQIDRSGSAQVGRGMAIAGIVLGWVGVAAFVALIVLGVALLGNETSIRIQEVNGSVQVP